MDMRLTTYPVDIAESPRFLEIHKYAVGRGITLRDAVFELLHKGLSHLDNG